MATRAMRAPDDHRHRHGHRFAGGDALGDSSQLRPRLVVDALDEHLEDAAACESDGQCTVVAHAEGLVPRDPVGEDLLAHEEQCALDAATAYGANHLTVGRDQHRGAPRLRGGLPGRHHRCKCRVVALPTDGCEPHEHFAHVVASVPRPHIRSTGS